MIYLANTIGFIAFIYFIVCVVYFFIQEKFIFVPTLPGEPFESKLTTATEEFIIATPNKGSIHALLLKVENPKGIVFYFHGNTGSLKRWQFMAEEVSLLGYDVFVLDYRGYGRSKGRRSEAYMHRDHEFCYDLITQQYKGKRKIIYGRSLGTGFATRLASRRQVDKLALETPYFNFVSLAKWYLPFLPVTFLLRYRFRSDICVQHVHCPIHIFHGNKDIIIPYQSALNLFHHAQTLGKDVKMTTVVGGKHSNLNSFPLFHQQLESFLS